MDTKTLTKDEATELVSRARHAITDYRRWIATNEIHPDERVKVVENPKTGHSYAEYSGPMGKFTVDVYDTPSAESKVTIITKFGDTRFNATMRDDTVTIQGCPPVYSEHWSNFHNVFSEPVD